MGTDAHPIAQDASSTPRGIRAVLKGVHPVWWLNLAIWIAALALFLGPIDDLPPLHEPYIEWWWLALGFLVGERCVVHLEFSRNAHSFSLGDVPLVFGLVLASGSDLVIAAVVGPALTLLLDRRLPPIKLFFNLGQFALSVCLANLICYWLSPVGTDWGPQLAIAVLIGAQVSATTCVALIGAAISLSEGWLGVRQLGRMFATDLTVTVTNSSLGLVAALIVSTEPWALPLLVVPLLTVFLAYRAYVTERKRGERLEFLYEANRTLSRSPEIAEALEGLLARSLDAFRAERAEIILWTPDKPPLRTTLGPGDHKEVMAEVDPAVAVDLQSLVSNDRPVVTLPDAAHGSAISEYLGERGVQKAMLAMLPGEDRVIGTLMLSNRYGVVRDFSADDLKLFETLANNASVALQYDRLEQAIARLKDLQQQLRHQAFHDSLTDLPNRALFISSVREALDTAPEELAVLFIDVDDFKTVNDTLGHAVGDELLVGVADRLRSCVRPQDEIARLGGDEFAVRLHDANDAEGAAESVAKRIMEAFQLPIEAGGELLSVRLSVGIASARQGASDEDELIRHADMAMYQAKMAGKACFERFDPEAQAAMLHRRQMKDDLRRAVETGELAVHYQPIVALATGAAESAEALVRWEHPERGRIMPAEFIPLAEETWMIVAIGRFVLREACLQARRWQEEAGAMRAVHVNLSALELRQDDLIDTVREAIENAGIAPSDLVLEITESQLLEDAEHSVAALHALRELGVRLALDDFGTGYSSLSYLHSLPLDILKIAKPFVDRVAEASQDSFVRMMIDLAKALELEVIAEGIETAEQVEALRVLQSSFGQGFYLARPEAARTSVQARSSAPESGRYRS
jgi:diguanylate cyclase (GGDEF)-like protein